MSDHAEDERTLKAGSSVISAGDEDMSRFGRQPAADVLKELRIPRPEASRRIGVKYSILNNTLAGHNTPSEKVKKGLAEITGKPLEELFTAEPLARVQGKRHRWGASVTDGDDLTIRRQRKFETEEEFAARKRREIAEAEARLQGQEQSEGQEPVGETRAG